MGKKIFIVDDDSDIIDAISMVLTKHNFSVASSLTASDALEKIKKEKPDLIILDVMFPEDPSKGFDLSRVFHSDPFVKNIPVVILSAVNIRFKLGFSKNEIDEEWMPVREFIEKPVDPDKLLRVINKILQ
ncbi:MAG: response regulator [Deltaproteobacteria bacterium]|nr:response regulator [Deltaproteobacteria bacterium]